MKIIDVETWNRKAHFNCFSKYTNPVFSMSVRLDVSKLLAYSKRTDTSFFTNFVFVVTKCLNELEEFRIRLKNGKVVVYDKIRPSYIVMNKEGVIVTCNTDAPLSYPTFYKAMREDVADAEKVVDRQEFNETDDNDLFYMSCMPWVDFTTMTNPYNYVDEDNTSIPRLAWGKYVKEGDAYKMTLDISAHHALMDGYPLTQAFVKIQKALDDTENFLK